MLFLLVSLSQDLGKLPLQPLGVNCAILGALRKGILKVLKVGAQ